MRQLAVLALLLAALLTRGLAARAGEEKSEKYAENYLFGDWGGLRTSLDEQGIKAKLLLITDPYGNTTGGKATGFTTYNLLAADLFLDSQKLLGLPGGTFQVGFAANFGSQLSANVIGNTFPVQGSDAAPPGPRLTTVSYTQSLFNDRLSLRVGRLTIDNLYTIEFAGSEYFRQFTTQAIDDAPFALFYNPLGVPGYPETTWGARVRYQARDDLYVMAGVYNGDPSVLLPSRHGLDFTLNGPAYAIAELGWQRNQTPQASGLPGNLKLGAYRRAGAATDGGRQGFYLVADQALTRLGAREEGRQLGVFGSLVATPNPAVNPMPFFFMTGLVATGPLASRPKDVLALGVAYGGYSADVRPRVSELTLELSYALQLLPGLTLQPGLQLLVHPGGDPATPTALAAGVNAVISF
jgi:porin